MTSRLILAGDDWDQGWRRPCSRLLLQLLSKGKRYGAGMGTGQQPGIQITHLGRLCGRDNYFAETSTFFNHREK